MRRRGALVCLLALAGPAQALDCSKASTKAEQAICADPAARAADDDLGKAFAAAMALMSASDKAALAKAQARWIGERDSACAGPNVANYSACLTQQSLNRRNFLAAEPEAGPGAPGRLAPFIRHEKGSKRKAAVDLQLLKYPAPATPAERAFNAAVERDVGSPDEPGKDDPVERPWEHDRAMRLAYASPRLMSAHMDGFDDMGGAHPSSFSVEINILVEEGREAKFDDLVDARAAEKLFAFCLKAVLAQKKQRLGPSVPPEPDLLKSVAEATAGLNIWSFGAQAATLTYNPYVVGSYAEGPYECVIPYATLKPLARPGFPLP